MKITLAFHIFNKERWIESVVRSWLDTCSGNYALEVIAVFDDLTDSSDRVVARVMADYPRVEYVPLTMTAGWEIRCDNAALARATGDVIVFIQDDNWMYTPGWDAVLVETMQQVGQVGVVALLAGGRFNSDTTLARIECDRPHKGEAFTIQDCENAPLGVWVVDFVTRPCAAWVSVARTLGGFDEAFYPMDWDETDFSFRAHRAGYMNLYIPFDLLNLVGKKDTVKQALMIKNYERGKRIFMDRHEDYLSQRYVSPARLYQSWEQDDMPDVMTRDDIQRMIEQCGVSAGNGPYGRGWKIMQNPKGVSDFLISMRDLGVHRVLELGSAAGGFARFMHEVMGWDVTSVDIVPPDPPVTWRFLHMTTQQAASQFGDNEFDLVFIDSNGFQVRENHDLYAHTAHIVALHDVYSQDADAPQPGFWRELARQDGTLKPNCHENPEWPGIGWYVRTPIQEQVK